jgi:hypothetical protein
MDTAGRLNRKKLGFEQISPREWENQLSTSALIFAKNCRLACSLRQAIRNCSEEQRRSRLIQHSRQTVIGWLTRRMRSKPKSSPDRVDASNTPSESLLGLRMLRRTVPGKCMPYLRDSISFGTFIGRPVRKRRCTQRHAEFERERPSHVCRRAMWTIYRFGTNFDR